MKGVYALVISVGRDMSPRIGSLGKVPLKKGRYVYTGSAQNGLEQRIARHRRKEKKKFWHIDYLLDSPKVEIEDVFWKHGNRAEECRLAGAFGKRGAAKGFGCSDCRCFSHLLEFRHGVIEELGMRRL